MYKVLIVEDDPMVGLINEHLQRWEKRIGVSRK